MYEELIKKLRNRRVCIQNGGNLETDSPIMKEAAEAIEELQAELRQAVNELCLYCGQYKTRHLGSCDGCRWMPLPADKEGEG